jgi:hypothetical protein
MGKMPQNLYTSYLGKIEIDRIILPLHENQIKMRHSSWLFSALTLLLLIVFTACKNISESAKYGLSNGYYEMRTENREKFSVFVYSSEDSLLAVNLKNKKQEEDLQNSQSQLFIFPETSTETPPPKYILNQYSFDLDVLAIPFKYRQPTKEMERQLITQFNGALYAGFRTDRFRIFYKKTPLRLATRNITHYGYSVGLFSGIGAESINPWVTQYQYAGEYEGLVWSKGIAVIVGINSITIGLGVGFDYLLDNNRKIWIYQNKPWLGLMLGLNLN